MGLKIKGIEFIYPGATRLRFNPDGKIGDHRDYFDFVGPTFAPVPVIGGLVRGGFTNASLPEPRPQGHLLIGPRAAASHPRRDPRSAAPCTGDRQ